MEYRPLGKTDLRVSVVSMGCWPIAGMTSPGTTDENSIATIQACFDLGINHLDTAYMYGPTGESERLIARAIRGRRDELVLATKGGLHISSSGQRDHDARPETIRRECEESLGRLETDRVELYYLHAPDPNVPVADSAAVFNELRDEGKIRAVGVSNVTLEQLDAFNAVCPVDAFQPHYNMLQREIEKDTLPWCRERGVAVLVYWPLLKGLLAGKMTRETVIPENDSRRKYAMFHGREWEKNHDLIDRLRAIADESGHTVAQLVINWTFHQPGITVALCGAKRPEQIRDTAGAADWQLTEAQRKAIDQALQDRGTPEIENPV